MTATPENLLDEVMRLLFPAEDCNCLNCELLQTDIRQAVEAYGRACRIEELRKAWDELAGGEVVVGGYLDTRIAELEAEG